MRHIYRRVVRTETTVTWTVTYSDDASTAKPRPAQSSGHLLPPAPSGSGAELSAHDQIPTPETESDISSQHSDLNG